MQNLLMLIALLWGLFMVFPHPVFNHTAHSEHIRLYSRSPLPENVGETLRDVESRLRSSTLFNEGFSVSVFICDSEKLYRILNPFSGGEFGVHLPIAGRVYFRSVSADLQLVYRGSAKHSKRDFVSACAHESAHGMIADSVGLWRENRMVKWKKEGLADYISGRSTLHDREGVAFIRDESAQRPVAYNYWLWSKMVSQLINSEGWSEQRILEDEIDYHSLKARTIDNLLKDEKENSFKFEVRYR